MPTYEYVCQSCGTHVEVFQRFSEDPLTECGVCGGPLRKVFHPAGILFKGSGFYVTDSRSGGRKTAGAGAASSDGAGGDKAAKADTKDAPSSSSSSTSSKDSSSSSASPSSSPSSSSDGPGAAKEKSA